MARYDLLQITIFFANEDLIDYAQQVSFYKNLRMIMNDSNNCLPRQH